MTKLRNDKLWLVCGDCKHLGHIDDFSGYAQTSTPLIQCLRCGGPAWILAGRDEYPADRLFEYGGGRGIVRAWKDFPNAEDMDPGYKRL